jgi:hypothetical protein
MVDDDDDDDEEMKKIMVRIWILKLDSNLGFRFGFIFGW